MSLRQIADKLGLSVTTVSRGLAEYPDVAEETRRRIRAEADRIGYVPNATARRLQKGRADAIGIAVPSGFGTLGNSYLSSGFVGAWSRLAELDQDLVLLPTGDAVGGVSGQSQGSAALRRAVSERRVDGMVLMRPRRHDPRIEILARAGLPFVLLDADMADRPDLVAVGTDHAEAARLVCRRLGDLGHRRFVAIGPEEDYDFVLSRFEHLAREAAAQGLGFDTVTAAAGETGGREATERLIGSSGRPPPPLVFLTNRMTVGGLLALAHSPWVVGRHAVVIGFGDSPTLQHGVPATTVVDSPMFEMARHAVDLLVAARDRRPLEARRLWTPTLIVRQSDGPPAEPQN